VKRAGRSGGSLKKAAGRGQGGRGGKSRARRENRESEVAGSPKEGETERKGGAYVDRWQERTQEGRKLPVRLSFPHPRSLDRARLRPRFMDFSGASWQR
jgi:hypothetical protein